MMRRAVFLDRDGVINRVIMKNGVPHPPLRLCDLEILPGVTEALTKLHEANFLLIVITNQPDVARGVAKKSAIEKINTLLSSLLPLDAFKTCYHDDRDKCECRKPMPGALFQSAKEFNIDLSNSFMVGDRWRDIEAGYRAGCTTFFIDYHYAERLPDSPNFKVTSLLEAQRIITREL